MKKLMQRLATNIVVRYTTKYIQVFEDEDSIPDPTVTFSIGEGEPDSPTPFPVIISLRCIDGGGVEAQTPDGTRVATPNTSKDASSSRSAIASKASYATALKAKPTDWHLEFSMDDHVLPLDLTIYGAIHQHEMRKKAGVQPSSSMWQGIHTVKFRKLSGPPPGQEGRRRHQIQPDLSCLMCLQRGVIFLSKSVPQVQTPPSYLKK